MENVKFYEAPEVLYLDAQSEGVLCQSGFASSGFASFKPYEEINW